jgi:cytochrome P450
LSQGDHVFIDVRTANRDPAVFDHPDEVQGGRHRGAGLSFGYGSHSCLGIAVARLQLLVALRTLCTLEPPVRPIADGINILRSGHLNITRSLLCLRGSRQGNW